jgi:predicted amidophosphoribosyltransferase
MEDIKREIYEQDAIDEKIAIATQEQMEVQGMAKCKICDCWVYEEDMYNGICPSCIDDIVADTTLEDVTEYASTLSEKDELALYTEYLFNTRQAIEILKEHAKRIKAEFLFKQEIVNYINNDTGHYIDYLDEKGAL